MGKKVYNEVRFEKNMVTVGENESLESALRRFKKKVEDEGIIKEYRDRQFFIKPSMKRRLKRKEAARKTEIQQENTAKKLEYASNIK